MPELPFAQPRSTRTLGFAAALVEAVALMWMARGPAISTPSIPGYDESLFLVHGMAWAAGLPPGTETRVNKPPALAFLFAAAHRVFGTTVTPTRVAMFLSLVGTALLCWLLAAASGGPFAGIVAALAFHFLSVLQNRPDEVLPSFSENLFVLPLAALVLFLRRDLEGVRRDGWRDAAGAGIALGIGIQIRQNGFLMAPLCVAARAAAGATGAGFASVDDITPVLSHGRPKLCFLPWHSADKCPSHLTPILPESAGQVKSAITLKRSVTETEGVA